MTTWIIPDCPCAWCGHDDIHDADGCMFGGRFGPLGQYEPGPDACECVAFEGFPEDAAG